MPEGLRRKLKVLVVRPDRIGDVVLSTPVFEALKSKNPETEIVALVREAVLPVVEHNPFLTKVIQYAPDGHHQGISGFWSLVKSLSSEKFDAVVILQVQWRVTLAVWLSRIPYRLGPYSKWYSYILLNRGTRQHRSLVEMHESDYNLMLLRRFGVQVSSREIQPLIVVDADAKERMRQFLKSETLEENQFVIVHPGMGGSALNWPQGYYVDLISVLALRGLSVVVTGSAGERHLVDAIYKEVEEKVAAGKTAAKFGKVSKFIGPMSASGLSDFIALESLSKLVVAPSTGPLHMATALGKSTVSFFPPIRVQSALRWGPYVKDENRHVVLVPGALCGQDFKCAGKRCHFYFCMERISVEEAVGKVLEQWEQ